MGGHRIMPKHLSFQKYYMLRRLRYTAGRHRMPQYYQQTYVLKKGRFSKVDRSGRPLERGSNVTAKLQARRVIPMKMGGLTLTPLPYIYTHILYLVGGSSSNVLSSTRTRTCTQLGPSLVIMISLALFLPIPHIPTIFPWSPARP